jgi:hypothetical protein
MWKCSGESRKFHHATRHTEQAQEALLLSIVRANLKTEFGTQHGFSFVRSIADFQQRVPTSRYADYQHAIDRIAMGEANELTREPVRLLEPTSGSTGGEKLIPYTSGLRQQFQRGVAAWIADLLRSRPALRGGRAYWSISPALGPARKTTGGIPIGFDDDTAYLGRLEQFALRGLLVAPPVEKDVSLQDFRYATLLSLLRAGDLRLISIWSPSFLTALLASLREWLDRLCYDLQRGMLSPPSGWRPPANHRSFRLRPTASRAAEVRRIFRAGDSLPAQLRALWPRLSLISCWTDAAAAGMVHELAALFPWVEIQPKGLLATEGFVSFPLHQQPAPALAVRSHFFEFASALTHDADDIGGAMHLAHQLELGQRYRVLLTTAGGLYRYHLGDEVQVMGFLNRCPLLRFIGKSDRVSDQVGEKLAEVHVRDVIERALSKQRLSARFSLLSPSNTSPVVYRLYLQLPQCAHSAVSLTDLQRDVEAGLTENPHYRYAVGLKQLAPADVRLLSFAGPSAWTLYERQCLERGQRAGDIKPAALDAWTGWAEVFRPLEVPVHAHRPADDRQS